MRFIAIALLCLVSAGAEAKQSPYPPITEFNGDRYSAHAQMGADVAKAIQAKRHPKVRYLYPTRKRPPVVRQRWKHVPVPVPRPVISDAYRVETPLSVREGLGREVTRAVGRPAAWCGWWLGRHLGMPDRRLWLARNWASVGARASGPQVGAIVVWRHHVGLITGHNSKGWVVRSGNDGHAVRERPRSVAGAIAFRRLS